jgi:hypothetical protein
MEMVQVTCPPGAVAGSMVSVNTPSGLQMQAQVPEGVEAGMPFQVQVPREAPMEMDAPMMEMEAPMDIEAGQVVYKNPLDLSNVDSAPQPTFAFLTVRKKGGVKHPVVRADISLSSKKVRSLQRGDRVAALEFGESQGHQRAR